MESNPAALVSGEGVRLALEPAGVGSRTIAALIDLAVEFVALLILIVIDASVAGSADGDAFTAITIAEFVLVLAGYPIVSEWLTPGRTLGKLCLGLRVVRDDGGPIGFRQALVRGLAGMLIEKPGVLFPLSTLAGLATISSSTREKRIGDMMAGTVVLNERCAPQGLAPPPAWVPVPLQPWVLSLDLHRLDDRLALSTRQFVSRAHSMSPQAQAVVGEDLRQRVLAVVAPPPPPGAPTALVLTGVLAERRRRAAAGTPGPWAPPTDPSSRYAPPGPAEPPGPPAGSAFALPS